MAGLHGRDDAQCFIARDIPRVYHLGVLDTITPCRAAAGGSKGVESHFDSTVADGVEANLKSSRRTLLRHGVQARLIVTRQSAVSRVIRVRREQSGGSRA